MLLLRYIFGLRQGTPLENPPLQIPISLPELAGSSIKDAVIIALDTAAPLVQSGDIDLVRRF
jgi:hypothetical protein